MDQKEAAFLERIETHKGILFKVCRLYQDREEDREDLLQDIIAQLWSSYDSFRGESQFSSWMYRVALNTAIVFLKKSKNRFDHMVPYPDLPDEIKPVFDRDEQYALFLEAVQQLNKIEKALIFLYMEGQSGKDIAQILGVSPANVRVRLMRVKDKLRIIIKTKGYEF